MDSSGKFAPFFQRLIDAPDAALAAIRRDPALFAAGLVAEEQGRLSADAAIPAFHALGALLFDERGRRMPLDGADWLPRATRFAELDVERRARKPGARLFTLGDEGATPVHALWAPVAETQGWNLPGSLRQRGGRP